MTKHLLACTLAMAAVALAQNRPEDRAAQNTGTIRGVVLDAGTGDPVNEADVSAQVGAQSVDATTDAQGAYTLKDVPMGKVRLRATMRSNGVRGFGAFATKLVTLGGGQEVTGVTSHR